VHLESRVRPSEEEIGVMCATYKGMADEFKATHLLIRKLARSFELQAMWDVLARESETEDACGVNEAPEQSSIAGDELES
jgi:hypothetical protein